MVDFRKKEKVIKATGYCILCLISVFLFYLYGYSFTKSLKYLLLLTTCFHIASVDRNTKKIPNRILLFLLGARIAILAVEMFLYREIGMEFLKHALIGLAAGFLILWLCHIISGNSLGMGDVKLGAVIGFYTGAGSFYATIIIACICAAVYGIVQIFRKKIGLRDEVPFAPFLAAGLTLVMWTGI